MFGTFANFEDSIGVTFILALFFAELNFSDYQIGLFMTLTLLGDVFLGTALTLVADRVGRRRVLLAGSSLMVLSGIAFACFENFWILLLAAIVGVISATGGDFGPFRSIEESMISHLTSPETRADVLAWYVTTSTLGSAVGSEAGGRIVHTLQGLPGWDLRSAYHALFWVYAVMGVVNAVLVLMLTNACESDENRQKYSQVPQNEEDNVGTELAAQDRRATTSVALETKIGTPRKGWLKRSFTWLTESLAQISAPTRAVMYKLWIFLALDSVADGMVPYSLTNYYIDEKFHPSKATLGDAQSAAYLLGGITAIFAGPLARKIGLINTMVFTHIPSSAAVLIFPAPTSLWLTIVLLFVRTGLNNMDQAPRSAFIAAVVKPEERTAVMGITSMLRTLAATTGPSITGLLAGDNRFWIAFVAAGVCRLVYDVGLWFMFVNMPLHQHEVNKATSTDVIDDFALDTSDDDEEALEMRELTPSESRPEAQAKLFRSESHSSAGSSRLAPMTSEKMRRRSPSPLPRTAPYE